MAEWLIDEDPELLGATLSLVAAWGKREEELSSTSDSLSADESVDGQAVSTLTISASRQTATGRQTAKMKKTSPAPRAARPQSKNISRERRKMEIELLREESERLEDQLVALQRRREDMLRPHYNGGAIQTTAPVWENLARRQLQSRKRAEDYNARLRTKAADQALVVRGLMDAIQLAMQRQAVQEKIHRVRLPIDVSQRLSEEQQLRRLQENETRWRWALSLSPKFQEGELQFMDFHIVQADGQSATLDLYTSNVLPYPVASVADLGWSMFQNETSGCDEDEDEEVDKYVQDHRNPDDTIIAVFSMESSMGGTTASTGTIHGKWVARRGSHNGGTQRLMNTMWHYELEGFGNELDGISVEEDTWLRMADAKEIGHPHLNGPLTVLQHVRRLRIVFNRSHRVDRKHIKIVTDMFIKQIVAELKFIDRNLENTLMIQSLNLK